MHRGPWLNLLFRLINDENKNLLAIFHNYQSDLKPISI